MNTKIKIGLVVLFVLILLLFNPPFISIPQGMIGGIPSVMVYLGVVWLGIILAMKLLLSKED